MLPTTVCFLCYTVLELLISVTVVAALARHFIDLKIVASGIFSVKRSTFLMFLSAVRKLYHLLQVFSSTDVVAGALAYHFTDMFT